MSIGKYEREALEKQRDKMFTHRAAFGLSPWEGRMLDDLEKEIAKDDLNKKIVKEG